MSWYPFSSNRSFGISSKVRIVTEAPEGKPPSRCQSSSETSSAQPSSSATYTAGSSHRSSSCSNYGRSVEVWSFRDWEWKSSSGLTTKRQVLGTRESLHSFSESSRSASKAVSTLTGETSPRPSISQPGPSWPQTSTLVIAVAIITVWDKSAKLFTEFSAVVEVPPGIC